MDRLAPSMLAALMTLSTGFATVDAVYAPAARADEEEVGQHELLYYIVHPLPFWLEGVAIGMAFAAVVHCALQSSPQCGMPTLRQPQSAPRLKHIADVPL